MGQPVSIAFVDSTSVRYLGFGPSLESGPSQPSDFWDYLRSLGGEWMWDGVEEEGQDLQWLVDGLKGGTIIAVTDGSCDRQVAPTISGAGLVLCCTSARRMLRANFYEQSKSASLYRGELLGLVALHTLLLALARFYDLGTIRPKICCDNISALRQSSWRRRRVKTGASQADVLRVIRTIRLDQLLKPTYEHVYGHQDRKKLWWNLPLEAQLNCVCDGLAKAAVSRSLLLALP